MNSLLLAKLKKYFLNIIIKALMDNHQPCLRYEAYENCFMVAQQYILDLDGRLDLLKKSMVIYNSLTSTSNNPA